MGSFRFRILPTAAVLIGVPLFLGLGFWQLDRAEEKRRMAQAMKLADQASAMEPLEQIRADPDLRYRKARVRGEFLPEQQFFIENRKHQGRTGLHVITPLRTHGSGVLVLVNRGWIPSPAGPEQEPLAPIPPGLVDVNGVIEFPSPPAITLHDGALDPTERWGQRWPYLTTDLFARRVAAPVQPFVLLQDRTDPHGFTRQWPRMLPKEAMHIGYAIQWFAFALIALAIWLRLSYSPRDDAQAVQES